MLSVASLRREHADGQSQPWLQRLDAACHMPTEVEELGENAERCLRLTRVVEDENTKVILEEIASEFETRAASQYSKASA